MSPRQVFIESNTTGTGRRFAQLAAELGHAPLLIASDPARYPYVAEDGLDTRTADTGDVDGLVLLCRELEEREGLVGVGSSSEYFIEAAARVAQALDLPGPDPDAVARCRDKYAQRQRFAERGVGSPAFRLATTVEEGLAAARELGWPVVAKPREGSGSIGVLLCRDEAELRPHVAKLVATTANERGIPIQQGALLEETIEGPEFSVEVFDGAAQALVQKHLGPRPFFVEIGHDHPAGVDEAAAALLREEAERAVEALGLTFGPAHVELKLAADGPQIIEVNPRLAGGWIPEMVRLSTGVDLVEQTVRRQAGMPSRLEPTMQRCASIRFLLLGDQPSPERLSDVRAMPGVVEVALYPPRPGITARQGDFRDRVGHVLVVGDSRADVDLVAARAIGKLQQQPVG